MNGTCREDDDERLSVLQKALAGTRLQVTLDSVGETPCLHVINRDLRDCRGTPLLAERITVRRINGRLTYCWTQGDPICDANAPDMAKEKILKALTVEEAPPVCR